MSSSSSSSSELPPNLHSSVQTLSSSSPCSSPPSSLPPPPPPPPPPPQHRSRSGYKTSSPRRGRTQSVSYPRGSLSCANEPLDLSRCALLLPEWRKTKKKKWAGAALSAGASWEERGANNLQWGRLHVGAPILDPLSLPLSLSLSLGCKTKVLAWRRHRDVYGCSPPTHFTQPPPLSAAGWNFFLEWVSRLWLAHLDARHTELSSPAPTLTRTRPETPPPPPHFSLCPLLKLLKRNIGL